MAASEETGLKQARKWKDEEVNTLIDLLEQQSLCHTINKIHASMTTATRISQKSILLALNLES